MVTGPMFDSIGWGTYAFFAAMNIVLILPCVVLFFPETKKYSLEDVSTSFSLYSITDSQLDLIFAIAHNEGRNPVAVSRSGDIPEAGTIEAERAMGRDDGQEGVRKRRLSGSKGGPKVETTFAEDAGRQA